MIFYFNANGTPVDFIPDSVYQGSVKANDVFFVSPNSSDNVINVAFELPDGSIVDNNILTLVTNEGLTGFTDQQGRILNVWKTHIPSEVTKIAGLVKVQFTVTTNNGEIITTAKTTFTVDEGVVVSEPIQGDSYSEVMTAIASILTNSSNIGLELSGKLSKSSSTSTVYVTNSEGEQQNLGYSVNAMADAFIVRDSNGRANVSTPTTGGNIANKDYVDIKVENIETTVQQTSQIVQAVEEDMILVNSRLNGVEEVAQGANMAISFSDYEQLIQTIGQSSATDYKVGQNIYIEMVNVPDLWIAEILEGSTQTVYTSDEDIKSALDADGYITVGYYKICQLETQKADLTQYFKKSNIYTVDNEDGSVDLVITNI